GGLVEQHVEARADEIHEHQLDNRAQPGRRGADGHPHEAHLADRRVDDAFGAEAADETARGAQDPAPGVLDSLVLAAAAARHVLAHDDDGRVLLHGLPHGFVERLDEGERAPCHGQPSPASPDRTYTSVRRSAGSGSGLDSAKRTAAAMAAATWSSTPRRSAASRWPSPTARRSNSSSGSRAARTCSLSSLAR